MPFLRQLNQTAPGFQSPWPVSGIAYVAAFMGPIAAGPIPGLLSRDWITLTVGLPIGVALAFINAWLSDRYLDPLFAKYQPHLIRGTLWVFLNTVAFAWAFLLSALSMAAPLLVLTGTSRFRT